jgi:mannosyltransferase
MPGSRTAQDHSSALMPADAVVPAPATDADVAQGSPPSRHWTAPRWLPPGICGLAGLVSGAYALGVPSLWRDEAATIEAAQRSVPQIFALLHHVDAVNGIYYLLMHPVVRALGTSATTVRLPSVAAMAVAAAFTAALGRRMAEMAKLPAPALTGLLAGLLFTAAPQMTRYAQEARAYGIATMLATIATYLLIRALADGRWRWWAGYGIAIAAAGLFNVLSLLLVAAHGLSLLLARTGAGEAPEATVPPRQLARWATAAGVAGTALSPLLVLGYLQRGQIAWIGRPKTATILQFVMAFAGSRALVLPVAVTALCGVLAGAVPRRTHALTPGVIALPWLAAPAMSLVALSQIHPVFITRYVLYSQPALALLCAAGLSWLAGLAATTPLSRIARPLAWLPSALIVALFAAMLARPQQTLRLPYSPARTDNLRSVSAILSTREHPGDAILYLPRDRRIMSWAYPGPFRHLNDIALRTSPLASVLSGAVDVYGAADFRHCVRR